MFNKYKKEKQENPNSLKKKDKSGPNKQKKSDTSKNKKNLKQKIRKSVSERRRWFAEHILKAGFEITPSEVEAIINKVSVSIGFIIGVFFAGKGIVNDVSFFQIILAGFLSLVSCFFLSVILLNIFFRVIIDINKFKRRLEIEEVLADFFQLVSANIRAGMPIDRALWYAVRPRFGVLAKEIEIVAKKVFSGGDLENALIVFANKYDSDVVLRSVNLLNEGVKAGGNVGDLLDKISTNLQEMRTLKKEMAANVTTYVIFITFAAIIAAPLLFGLSGEMLNVVQGIASDVDVSGSVSGADTSAAGGMGGIGMSMSVSEDSIKQSDYRLFVYTCLFFSSLFSAMIVSTIKNGNVKQGIQYIPVYMAVSVVLYWISSAVMNSILGGLV
ncbi:MAG: type II secretion system F family protein [Nanobdellota archaeon]